MVISNEYKQEIIEKAKKLIEENLPDIEVKEAMYMERIECTKYVFLYNPKEQILYVNMNDSFGGLQSILFSKNSNNEKICTRANNIRLQYLTLGKNRYEAFHCSDIEEIGRRIDEKEECKGKPKKQSEQNSLPVEKETEIHYKSVKKNKAENHSQNLEAVIKNDEREKMQIKGNVEAMISLLNRYKASAKEIELPQNGKKQYNTISKIVGEINKLGLLQLKYELKKGHNIVISCGNETVRDSLNILNKYLKDNYN